MANVAIAHASEDPSMNTLNVAMPDLTAEYWCTFIPAGKAPVFRLNFPSWSRYSALTAYDINALPIASLNSREVGADPRVAMPDGEEGPAEVNLMGGAAQKPWHGPLVSRV